MPKQTYRISTLARGAFVPFALILAANASAQVQPRPRVRAVILQRDAVFDSSEAKFWPYRVANALHAETRPNVIRRELLLGVGDPYDNDLVAESERNLRALGIFRDVRIDPQVTDSGVVLVVRTLDAWTTTVGMSVATSGSQSVLDVSLQETNLLGTRTIALLAYNNDVDRSSITFGFDTPRAIDNRIGLGATIIDRSDGSAMSASHRLPFLSLSSRSGGSLTGSAIEGRILQFRDGAVVDSLWREAALLRADAAYAMSAGPRGYVRLGNMQIAWGTYNSNFSGSPAVTMLPAAFVTYQISLTPNANGSNTPITATLVTSGPTSFQAQNWELVTPARTNLAGHYIAVGRWQ